MAFEYPSEKTKNKKQAKQQAEAAKEAKMKSLTSVLNKKEGSKKELAMEQIERSISSENVGDGKKITKKGLKNIVDAAADDKQLTRTKRSILRHYKSGGRVKKNSSRMNKLEELGRVDSEKAYSSKGKKNLKAEKTRIVKSLNSRGAAKRGHGAEIK